MVSFYRVMSLVLLGCLPVYSVSAEEPDQVREAQTQVNEYRALRRACAVTQGEQRKLCFSRLNDSTAGYQKAKKFLAMQQPSGALLGQAQ